MGIELNGMMFCSMCDNANFGLAFYEIGDKDKEEERDKLLDNGLKLYEIITKGQQLETISNEGDLEARDAYERLESFYNNYSTPEEFKKTMDKLISLKESIEKMKNNENIPDEEILGYKQFLINLGTIFLREDLPKLRRMEEIPYIG